MERVTLYLRTALFSPSNDDPHVPQGIAVIAAKVVERGSGGLLVDATGYQDARGRDLDGSPRQLFIPWSKIDHAAVHDA